MEKTDGFIVNSALSRQSSGFTIEETFYEETRSPLVRFGHLVRALLPFAGSGAGRHGRTNSWASSSDDSAGAFSPPKDLESGLSSPSSLQSSNSNNLLLYELLNAVFGEQKTAQSSSVNIDKLLRKCQNWYLSLLNRHITAANGNLISALLGQSNEPARQAPSPDFTIIDWNLMYTLITRIARAIRSNDKMGLALSDITSVIESQRCQGMLERHADDYQRLVIQLAFCVTGWVTMLYEPSPTPERDQIQLAGRKGGRGSRGCRTDVIHHFSLPAVRRGEATPVIRQPLHRLLQEFGSLVPCADRSYETTDLAVDTDYHGANYWRGDTTADPAIMCHHVCFHTLQKIVRVRIQWVESLNLHMEFDQGRRTLKLFKYPAFCWLMARGGNESGDVLMSRLFEEKWKWAEDEEDVAFYGHHGVKPRSEDFFREIIQTYRLIFGQHKQSWKAYQHHARLQARNRRKNAKDRELEDPLLPLLCSRDWKSPESRTIYAEIDADDEVTKIYAATDFPFFGKRILTLQRFTKSQYPHDWKMLWHDSRDPGRWWTIWAVFFIGGGTIVIGLLTLIFQIMQVVYSVHPNIVVLPAASEAVSSTSVTATLAIASATHIAFPAP